MKDLDQHRPTLGVTTRSRDIYEDDTFEGLRRLDVVASSGRKLVQVMIREECTDQRFMRDLWALLDRHDRMEISAGSFPDKESGPDE